MLDIDDTGQKKLIQLLAEEDTIDWTDFEETFLSDMRVRNCQYKNLTSRQKSLVGRLWDKLISG